VAHIVAGVRDRGLRERALALVREQRADWPDRYAELLESESDVRTLALLYDALRDSGHATALERVVQETVSRPAGAPRFYVWLCRETSARPELQARADWGFLRRLLEAIADEALKGHRAALRQLFDTGGLAEQVAAKLDLEQAQQLLWILEREIGLEEHRKETLRRVAWARFPQLRDSEEEALYTTAGALETKRAEFEQLVRVEIPRNTEEIRQAAAHGDLRENFEYKAARERQEMLSSRAKTLHEELRRARELDPACIDPSCVRVGTRVRLEPAADGCEALDITILGPWDSDPAQGVLSYMAPAVSTVLGARVGDRVQFGDLPFVVVCIEVWQS
ncbi:MAG: GreA/GreB family elongation factor, partial [Candidatus Krumholzibacteriia bacterium]